MSTGSIPGAALEQKLKSRKATIGVIGLGYVGLPLVVGLARAGFQVRGLDVSKRVVEGLNAGRSHVGDITDEEIAEITKDGRFRATLDPAVVTELDAAVICVPTPTGQM